jgi:hypothetical protein
MTNEPTNGWTRAEMLDFLMAQFHEATSPDAHQSLRRKRGSPPVLIVAPQCRGGNTSLPFLRLNPEA